MADGVERAIAFQRDFTRRRAEVTVRSAHGIAYLTPTLPKVYDLNFLAVDLGAATTAGELVDEAETILGPRGFGHRKIEVDDELGLSVTPWFREQGWRVEELLVMPHSQPAPSVDLARVEEVEPEVLVAIWQAGMRRDIGDPDTVAQLVRSHLGRRDGVDVRNFATRVDGRVASYCELFSDGRTGQIESVMTEQEFRGRGLGKAVVAAALAASQELHDFTFLVADANDWPREMYRKLGFEPAGTIYRFLLGPRDDSAPGAVEAP